MQWRLEEEQRPRWISRKFLGNTPTRIDDIDGGIKTYEQIQLSAFSNLKKKFIPLITFYS